MKLVEEEKELVNSRTVLEKAKLDIGNGECDKFSKGYGLVHRD